MPQVSILRPGIRNTTQPNSVVQTNRLAVGTKVLLKSLRQRGAPVALRLQEAAKEAQHGWFVIELNAPDHLAVFVKPLEPVGRILEVRHREDATRNR